MTHHQMGQGDNSLIHCQSNLCTHKFIFFSSPGFSLLPMRVNHMLIWQVQ
jgi:hypothetical protein